MRLTVPEGSKCERWEYVTDVILKEFKISIHQLQKRCNDDSEVFCKCLIAMILDEESAPAVYIANILKSSRITIYSRLKVSGELLETHPIFKRKYLKIIQIITENED